MKILTGKMQDGSSVTIEFTDLGASMVIFEGKPVPAWISVFKGDPFGELRSELLYGINFREGACTIPMAREVLDCATLSDAGVDVFSLDGVA